MESSESSLQIAHDGAFVSILAELGITLAVSTYEAGKVILLRGENGALATEWRELNKPMGLAVREGELTVGASTQIWSWKELSHGNGRPPSEAVTETDSSHRLHPLHATGHIDIHEMAWGRSELWVVNTRFSCLCSLDEHGHFAPRWHPPFVSALTPQDRCHLNGLAMVGDRPKYVTALGETDERDEWREKRAWGGVLMDVEHDEVLLRGLSMPHSPRWHDGSLWFLESGDGKLAVADPLTGETETVVRLPGFTRGLDFYGSLAFVGLSQIRDSALFCGIPLTERLDRRTCGIRAVDVKTGQVRASLEIEEGVQEIFAVQVLPDERNEIR